MGYSQVIEACANLYGLTKDDILKKKQGNVNANLAECKALVIYAFRQHLKLSFGQIGKKLNRARQTIHQEFQYATTLHENSEKFRDNYLQITSIYPTNTNTENMEDNLNQEQKENSFNEETQEQEVSKEEVEYAAKYSEENPSEQVKVESIAIEESPLAQPVKTRNLNTLVTTNTQTLGNTDALDELEQLEAQVREETNKVQPGQEEIPEMKFETAQTENTKEVEIKVDPETAAFGADAILNIVNFLSVEATHYYSKVPEQEVREAAKNGEVPKNAPKITQEFNDSTKKKLETNATEKLNKLVREPLKKVLQTNNVKVSPEMALVFGFIMFMGSMVMTARSMRKDADYFLEKLREENKIKTQEVK